MWAERIREACVHYFKRVLYLCGFIVKEYDKNNVTGRKCKGV